MSESAWQIRLMSLTCLTRISFQLSQAKNALVIYFLAISRYIYRDSVSYRGSKIDNSTFYSFMTQKLLLISMAQYKGDILHIVWYCKSHVYVCYHFSHDFLFSSGFCLKHFFEAELKHFLEKTWSMKQWKVITSLIMYIK